MDENQWLKEREALVEAIRNTHIVYAKMQIALLNGIQKEFGDGVEEVVKKTYTEEICKPYLAIAEGIGEKNIENLIKILWEPLRNYGYQFTIEEKDGGVQVQCTACPYATLYNALNGADWGFKLYCAADEYLVHAFNPEIGFTRTTTLMEGHECCNHFYYNKK